METRNSPINSANSGDVSSPPDLCPVDTEDYFELAYEADEFGVHIPEHSAAE